MDTFEILEKTPVSESAVGSASCTRLTGPAELVVVAVWSAGD